MYRVVIRIGDIFSVPIDNRRRKYFQFVGIDRTQLNSPVIRAFKKLYALSSEPDLDQVASGEVDFHAHVLIRWGLKMGFWEKVGKSKAIDVADVWFRCSKDSGKRVGDPLVTISERWYVWRISTPPIDVGKLVGNMRTAEIGMVISPDSIVHRMRTGEYDFVYPGF